MKYIYFLSVAAVVSFLFSCEKVIEFSGDEVKTKLVLNSILMPDSVVKIQLTESRFFLDNNDLFNKIDDAKVILWKDGDSIESLQNAGKGYYVGTYVPREGDNLRITASHSGFDPIECETQIVSPTPIIAVDTTNTRVEIRETTVGEYKNGKWIITDTIDYLESIEGDIDITLKDPADIAGYYAIRLDLHIRHQTGNVHVQPVYYSSNAPVFKTNNELALSDDDDYLDSRLSHLFSDELFDGREYKLKIKIYPFNYGYWTDEKSKITNMAIQVTLQSLSHSCYMYLKTREANSDSDFFTEPVQIYTNIKGGIGIFGNYSNSIHCIELKELRIEN